MGWQDFYRRRDALNAVLDHARRNPAGPLPVPDAFSGPTELLLALHYKWTLALTAQIELALTDPGVDPVDAVAAAWRATAARHSVLRRLLDAHADSPGMAAALEREQRLLGLASGRPAVTSDTPLTRVV